VRAELKSLFSMELSGSLEAYKPQDPKHFGIRVMAFIGSPDDERSDSFDLLVCTATWLADPLTIPGSRVGTSRTTSCCSAIDSFS
jgi:hypothetical protein